MTFSDIANFACSKVGETDVASVTFAQQSAINRYRILWDSYSWPATLDEIMLTIPANQPNFFTDSIYTQILNGAWSMSPMLVPIPAQYRDIGWVRQNAPGLALPNINAVIPAYYWRDQTSGVPMASISSMLFNVISASGDSCTITINGMVTDPSTGLNVEVTEVLSVSLGSSGNVSPANNFNQIFTLSKSQGNSRIGVHLNGSASAAFVMQPQEKNWLFNQYMFYPVPTSTWYMYLQVKQGCPDFNSIQTSDSPAIQNIDDALIAYCQADMLERQRQYSKAQAKQQEAGMLIQGVKDEIREQSEFVAQITPDIYDLTTVNGRITWRPSSSFF